MGEVACYYMHIYCDGPNHPTHSYTCDQDGFYRWPHEITNMDRQECLRELRRAGWLLKLKRTDLPTREGSGFCLCPKCRSIKGKRK